MRTALVLELCLMLATTVNCGMIADKSSTGQVVISGYRDGTIVEVNKKVSLACTVIDDTPTKLLFWYRASDRVETQVNIIGSIIESRITFVASPSDNEVLYMCIYDDATQNPPPTAKVRLTVHFPPENISLTSEPAVPRAGETLKLTCKSTSSNPPARLRFYRDGKKIETNNEFSYAENRGRSTTSVLRLIPNLDDDGAVYYCRATHIESGVSISDSITLDFKSNVETPITAPVDTAEVSDSGEESDAGDSSPTIFPEEVLLKRLFADYNKVARPGLTPTDTVTVQHKIMLVFLLDMNEDDKYLEMDVWLSQRWQDKRLRWDPSEYGSYDSITVPSSMVWTPDIVLYNSAKGKQKSLIPDDLRVHVDNRGSVTAISQIRFRSFCDAHLADAHTGEHTCTLKFSSWVYNGDQIKLEHQSVGPGQGFDMTEYEGSAGSKWDVVSSSATVNTEKYTCCPEPYMDITYTVTLRSRMNAPESPDDDDVGGM